ncbi:hypothetical protein BGX27_006952 [Mortierella sp. AM989]|nr:hypothetical protein BGX27_006952 [Mortierella sp. AM989]
MSILVPFFEYLLTKCTLSNTTKVFLVLTAYYTFKYRSHAIGTRPRFELKQPKGAVPFLGHLPLLASVPMSELYEFFVKQYNELGPVWSISLPGLGRMIQIDTPENLGHVLKTNVASYGKGPQYFDMLKDLAGHGAKWKAQRQISSSAFSSKALRAYTSNVFVVEARKVVEVFGKAADEGTVVDFQDVILRFTLNTFGGAAFGKSFGCLDDFHHVIPLVGAINSMMGVLADRLKNPFWKITERLDGTDKKNQNDRQIIRNYAKDIMEQRRAEGNQHAKNDFLQQFMDERDDEGNQMSDEIIIDNVITFMVAGRDTTANTLTWMFYLLLRDDTDKDIMARLVDEVDTVLEGADPTYESHKKQKYTEACFNEALRIFPPVPRNLRHCEKDDILPDGTKVYKGEWVSWSSYAMGRSEAIWGPDAKEYKPSRWMSTERPSQTKFNSFNAGPRVCPGQQFAVIEALTVISMILQSFDMELEEPSRVPQYATSMTFPMLDGLNVRFSRRSSLTKS